MSKLSQLIFCFLFALLNLTVTPALHAGNKVPTTTVEDNCNLPAPTGLTVTNITATSAFAQWNAVPGAVGYAISAIDLVTQSVYFLGTTISTSGPVTGLPPNTNIKLLVKSICSDENAGGVAETVFTTDIVIDIVANSFQGCNDFANGWTLVPNVFTIPVNTPYHIAVVNTQTNANIADFLAHGNGLSDDVKFYTQFIQNSTFINQGGAAEIYYNNVAIVRIEGRRIGQLYEFEYQYINGGGANHNFQYRQLPQSCNDKWPGGGKNDGKKTERSSDDDTMASVETTIIAAPNPFNEQFSLLTNGYLNEPATIQLFNLSGQLVQSITTVLDDQTISVVNTENLPDGMYIAKIQTSQTVNTIKVQKTSPK